MADKVGMHSSSHATPLLWKDQGDGSFAPVVAGEIYRWDTNTLTWLPWDGSVTGGGGGGGGAVTVADGADIAQGAKADAAWTSGDGTVISLLKKIASAGGSAVSVADGSDITEGTLADAAVVTNASGSLSAKLRGVVALLASVITGGKVTVDGSSVTQPVSGTFFQATQPVSGPLTDAQLRATPVPVSGTVATGGLTDTQLRATPVPVSGTVTANTGLTQPLTDTQLRASAVPVTANAGANLNTSALNLEATQALVKAKTDNLDVLLSTRTKPSDQQHVIVDSSATIAVTGIFFQATQPVSVATLPLPTNASQETGGNLDAMFAALGAIDVDPVRPDEAGSIAARLRAMSEQNDALLDVQKTTNELLFRLLIATNSFNETTTLQES